MALNELHCIDTTITSTFIQIPNVDIGNSICTDFPILFIKINNKAYKNTFIHNRNKAYIHRVFPLHKHSSILHTTNLLQKLVPLHITKSENVT